MRTRFLTSAAFFLGAMVCTQAQASGDDSCYPDWSLAARSPDTCNNVPFLAPGNDSRVNLRLLLADRGLLEMAPSDLSEDEISEGYGPVPFGLARLQAPGIAEEQGDHSGTAALNELLQNLGLERENQETAGGAFLEGEGSRCRSNTDDSALAFMQQIVNSTQLTQPERRALARTRMQLLEACSWAPQQIADLLPKGSASAEAEAFATYLRAAADFYSGRFSEAHTGFMALVANPQPWLKEVSSYMVARVQLNAAQEGAFDEYGSLKQRAGAQSYAAAEQALQGYLSVYPDGSYAASAKGLVRRVHWLAGEKAKLAGDYAAQLTAPAAAQRNVSLEALIQEIDTKLLPSRDQDLPAPLLAAVNDLMGMRADDSRKLTREQLLSQRDVLEQVPGLFEYLQAAFAFYTDHDPAAAIERLPTQMPAQLDYLAFSQQALRGLALEAKGEGGAAQALWLQLIPLARQPLQREMLELALAMSYERDGGLAKVFASDSPIRSEQVRLILLGKVADAPLLRQQATQGISEKEKATARFALLYKDLFRGEYAAFLDDMAASPEALAQVKLDSSLGYVYGKSYTLDLFQWSGEKADAGYACPSVAETAAMLKVRADDPKGLNCLGELVLRNGLDGMPLDQRPEADHLGGTEPGFKGRVFSRLEAYRAVIANAQASREDKAYALYRAINCYGPSGYNGCGGEDVDQPVRKAWFKQLKTTYGNTRWGKSQQYYW
ncbi:outer membrane assembly lipoprotein YfiO [Pseudomonas japonica]|uniref:outer membrane assembly lipoprotein YfiO n=1 Tax=Pseudomonas japonica TaxID=256466 RepID=UPI0015E40A0C|nr:outer membrane assembly lipoprotein YfiO [Pseudomonas japonica]MBA1291341.1 outer membrane assembly lipoprotein YfiO [Pseudomonas japonica]